jgi:hypothetical protein
MTEDEYWPEKFDVSDIEEAKRIILTPEGDASTEDRWAVETPPLVKLLREYFDITEQSILIDFGVGVGRVAKELINETGCFIVGVDISASMRTLGHIYCYSPKFMSCSVEGLTTLLSKGFRADFAYSAWTLQHSAEPRENIDLLFDALSDTGGLYVLNAKYGVLPVKEGWKFDTHDLRPILEAKSARHDYPPPPEGLINETVHDQMFSGFYWK